MSRVDSSTAREDASIRRSLLRVLLVALVLEALLVLGLRLGVGGPPPLPANGATSTSTPRVVPESPRGDLVVPMTPPERRLTLS